MPAKRRGERARVGLAALGQRKIGEPGVLARQAPRGLAVAREEYGGESFAHVAHRVQYHVMRIVE